MTQRLAGKRVLVTRPRERAEALCFLLEDEGADVVLLPVLELQPPDDERPLRAAAEQLGRYRWILFASPSAVDAFCEAVREAGTADGWKQVKVGAVGPATAKAAQRAGLVVAQVAEKATGEGLFGSIRESLRPGEAVLLPAAQEGRRELEDALTNADIEVVRVAAYKSSEAALGPELVAQALEPAPSALVFGSPRTVDAFLVATGERGRKLLSSAACVAIGPTTGNALREHAAARVVQSHSPTAEALVEAVVGALQ